MKILIAVVKVLNLVFNAIGFIPSLLLNLIAKDKLRGTKKTVGYTFFVYDSVLSFSYQKHACPAFWLTPVFFFLSKNFIDVNHYVTGIIVTLFAYAVGWGIEFYQRFTKKGEFDPWDAHVMFWFSLLANCLIILKLNI
jgi:hypothetical protein